MSGKCIFRCKNYRHLYSFPSDENLRKKWCKLLSLDYSRILKNHKVCDQHFEEIDGLRRPDDSISLKKLSTNSPTRSTATENTQNDNDPSFETIYLTNEIESEAMVSVEPPLNSPSKVQTNENCIKKRDASARNENCSIDALPLGVAFKEPPKRTYGNNSHQSHTKTTPKLDITATCYCRCHKGEDEKVQLNRKIDEMKTIIAEQSREINLLTSKNKVSEHLLKGKVKKISELQELEKSLRKTIEGLNVRISIMSKRQIKAAPTAGENSIILARMICDRRKKYTKSEVIVANKLYAISGRCYYFMRDVLKLNLPHPTTLLRNRDIMSPVSDDHSIYKECNNVQMDQEVQEPIVFSPENIHEYHEDEQQIEVDV